MDSFKKVSLQTLWQISGKVVSGLTGLLVLSLVARYYGQEGTGVFTLALTYLSFFYVVGSFGFNSHFLPLLIQEDFGVFRKLFGVRIVWSVILMIVAVVLAPLLPIKNSLFPIAVAFGALAILGSDIFETTNSLFQARLRYDKSALPTIIGSIVGCLLAIYFILSHLPVYVLPLSESMAWLVSVVCALLLLRGVYKGISPLFDLSFAKEAFIKAWPIASTLILSIVYFRLDSLFIAAFRSVSEAALYNVAYAIFQSAIVIPTYISNSYYPLMLGLLSQQDQKEKFKSELKKVLLIMLGISLFGLVATWVLAPLVIQIIAGANNFSGSVVSLRLLALGFPAYFLTAVLTIALIAKKRYRSLLLVSAVGLLTNVVLNLIFIPTYSFIAASLTTGISEYLILVLEIFILSKEI